MSAADVLNALAERNVKLWIEGDRLRYHGPKGALTDELRVAVSASKNDLIALLRERQANEVRTYPLSHGQRALWFLHRNDPDSASYHVGFSARIRSRVDVASLTVALQTLLDRHPALRTTFAAPDGKPVQTVCGHQELLIEIADLPDMEIEELREHVVERYRRPFNLETGPVFRAHLLTRDNNDHILLLVAHHIATDGWSQLILLEELVALYEAQTTGKPVELTRGKTQYEDFVRWQQELLSGPGGDRLVDYWSSNLAGGLPDLELPTDRPRPAVQHYRGATYAFEISSSLTSQLNEFARSTGATPYMILLAGFQILLHRYTGQQDILVGTASYGRNRPEFNDIVGYFINMLVQRGDLSGDPSFLSVAERVRESTLAAMDMQDLPFSLLVEKLKPRRDPSRSPIFQVCFVLHKFQHGQRLQAFQISDDLELRENFSGLELSPFPIAQMEGQFDLTLELIEWEDLFTGCFKYNTDLFDAATIERMAGHLSALLDAAVREPELPISQLPYLTEAEESQFEEWNCTDTEFESNATFHELFERQVNLVPDAPAAAFGDAQLSYAELDEQANQLANYLRSLGVERDALVGICVERSLQLIVAVLAVLKAGGAFLPLDPNYPDKRLAFMIDDSKLDLVLTQSDLQQRFSQDGVHTICLDNREQRELIDAAMSGKPNELASSDSLAYVIYTSGSSGTPKGVLLEHRGLVNVCASQQKIFELGHNDSVLQFASISFDAFVFELAAALTAGATLYLASKNDLLPGRPLIVFLQEREISFVVLTPSALSALPKAELPRLHTVTVAGEACSAELLARWANGRRFFNLYGPTETTIWASYLLCQDDGLTPSIGRPIGNTKLYILDGNERPVAVGVTGELCIGGAGVARSYLNRPDLTAEKFISDSFSGSDGKIYKTGDLARFCPDGNVEFLGRIDEQVKVRGFRIELGEVEAALMRHPSVREAVATVIGNSSTDQRLVGYVVPVGDKAPQFSELRDFLADQLPDYFIPSAFGTLTALPVTSNGKLDRKSLPAPDSAGTSAKDRQVPPRNDAERAIANIWRRVLATESIGVHDNFFDLGGHSLLLAEVQMQLEEEFQRRVSMVDLMQFPNVASLAVQLSRELEDSSAAAVRIQARASRQRDALRRRNRNKQRLGR